MTKLPRSLKLDGDLELNSNLEDGQKRDAEMIIEGCAEKRLTIAGRLNLFQKQDQRRRNRSDINP
jgi:hypothetical protein